MNIQLRKGQSVWFTSDTHYNHSNFCSSTSQWSDKSKTRVFESLQDMNDTIVKNINDLVCKNDYLFHLGDFSFGGIEYISEFRKRINCKNVHLILGNHDLHISNNDDNVQRYFSTVKDYLYLKINRQVNNQTIKERFVLFHYPIASWNGLHRGVIHLHGHTHLPKEIRISKGKSMDVGIDGNDYFPILMEEVLDIMKYQEKGQPLTLPKKW